MLEEVGLEGQQKLRDARVLIIGAGGLGAASITYLAAAGIGHIGVVDPDRVELSNLARQIIHETGDIGRLKVESSADRIAELNPEIHFTPYPLAVSTENAEALIAGQREVTGHSSPLPSPPPQGGRKFLPYQLVADGCDNFATRFAVNDACVKLGIPLISAAIAGWHGQLMTVMPGGPDYRALVHPDAPEMNTCRDSGVIGPLAGIIGCMQALEVIRVILGRPAYAAKLLRYDGLSGISKTVSLVHA